MESLCSASIPPNFGSRALFESEMPNEEQSPFLSPVLQVCTREEFSLTQGSFPELEWHQMQSVAGSFKNQSLPG
jgi:hypothetical protein